MYLVKSRREGDTVLFESTYIPAETAAAAASHGYPGPFDMTIEDTTATLTNGVVQRQMCFIFCLGETDTDTVTITGEGVEYIYVEIDEAAGTGDVKCTTDRATAMHTSPPDDMSVIKIPLYRLTDGVVSLDYRKTPQLGLQV